MLSAGKNVYMTAHFVRRLGAGKKRKVTKRRGLPKMKKWKSAKKQRSQMSENDFNYCSSSSTSEVSKILACNVTEVCNSHKVVPYPLPPPPPTGRNKSFDRVSYLDNTNKPTELIHIHKGSWVRDKFRSNRTS